MKNYYLLKQNLPGFKKGMIADHDYWINHTPYNPEIEPDFFELLDTKGISIGDKVWLESSQEFYGEVKSFGINKDIVYCITTLTQMNIKHLTNKQVTEVELKGTVKAKGSFESITDKIHSALVQLDLEQAVIEFSESEKKVILYTEDYKDSSFPEKSCNNCTAYRGKTLFCDNYPDISWHLECWQGELKGEPICQGDTIYLSDAFQVKKFTVEENCIEVKATDPKGKFFCNKENAEKYHKSLQPKLEIGKWYTVDNKYKDNVLIFITKIGTDCVYGYGFDYAGKWFNKSTAGNIGENWKQATEEEVKERLSSYCKKNYPIGTKFKSAAQPDNRIITTNKHYEFGNFSLFSIFNNRMLLYENGKWAEIVEKPLFTDTTGKHWYKSDFKEGEVFFCKYVDDEKQQETEQFIFSGNPYGEGIWIGTTKEKGRYHKQNNIMMTPENGMSNYRKATPDEILWLEVCEKLNKFIPFEEVMGIKKSLQSTTDSTIEIHLLSFLDIVSKW